MCSGFVFSLGAGQTARLIPKQEDAARRSTRAPSYLLLPIGHLHERHMPITTLPPLKIHGPYSGYSSSGVEIMQTFSPVLQAVQMEICSTQAVARAVWEPTGSTASRVGVVGDRLTVEKEEAPTGQVYNPAQE